MTKAELITTLRSIEGLMRNHDDAEDPSRCSYLDDAMTGIAKLINDMQQGGGHEPSSNVYDYYRAAFPNALPINDAYKKLDLTPHCGQEAVKIIDAAKALIAVTECGVHAGILRNVSLAIDIIFFG